MLLERPADSYPQKRNRLLSGHAGGAAFKLDPGWLVYSLRWKHKAEPPDFELVLIKDGPSHWVNTANLLLLVELRYRAPHAIEWTGCRTSFRRSLDAFDAARPH